MFFFAAILCLSSLSLSVPGAHVVSHEKKKNMIGKAFEHWLTPNISEYEIFVISIWIAVI